MVLQRLFFLFVFCFANRLYAQPLEQQSFDQYTTANGLSHNMVTGLAQDANGYLWITSLYGLNRYNGSQFMKFYSTDDSTSLGSDELWLGATWLDKRRLAVPGGGLHIIDTKSGKRRNIVIPYHRQKYQFKFNLIERVRGDINGDVYILSRSGFYHFDSSYKLVSRFDFYKEEEVPVTHFYFGRGLFHLDENRLLIIAIDGIYFYNKVTRKVKKMAAGDCLLLAEFLNYPHVDYQFFQHKPGTFFIFKSDSDSVLYVDLAKNRKVVSISPFAKARQEFGWRTKLIAESDSVFYMTGHLSGFFKLNFTPATGRLQVYPKKYFPSLLCNSLLRDEDRNLWIATNKGLFRQNPQPRKVQVAYLPNHLENKYPNIRIDDIWTSSTTVYGGARSEAGVFLFDKKTFTLKEQIVFKEKDGRNTIRAMSPIDSTHLLFGTHGPLILFSTKTKRGKKILPPDWNDRENWISELHKDRKGRIWVSTRQIYVYETERKNFNSLPVLPELLSVPYAIDEDTSGHIWMAGHGVARYNTHLRNYDILIDSFPHIKMLDKQVSALAVDRRNRVWFNSASNGIIGYDIARKKFIHITRNQGLPDNNIASLMVVDNKLWLACYSAIACIDLETFQISRFGKEDGFPDMPTIKGAHFYYDKAEGLLYLGMSTSVVRFNPDNLLQKRLPPKTFFENIVINGANMIVMPRDRLTTSWSKNELQFTIGTINFFDAASQRYAYRINRNDSSSWTEIGQQTSFNISGLAPGIHRVEVKCYSATGHWPAQISELNIVVLPPLWLRSWFLVVLGLLFLIALYLFIRWRISLVRRKEMIKTQIEKLKADNYKNQFELEQITNYFSSSLVGKKTEEEVLWDVSRNLIGRLDYEDCIIYLWNEDKTKMLQRAAYGPKGQPGAITKNVFEVSPGQGIVGHVVETRQPVLVKDTRRDRRYRVDDDFRLSELCVPIIHNNELLGVIDSEHHQLNYFSERDIKILTTIATLLGNKLKQIESESTLEAKKKELANTNEQLAEARLAALQAQMNPHFVFNALNSIKRMILDGDNEKASRYLSKFAQMIRMTLEQSKEVFVTLEDNIAYLKAYLEMEQLRFDDSFSFRVCVEKNLEISEIMIPSMALQPIVENAIWHGLMQAEGDKKIFITFSECENKICCTVEDNGIGVRRSEMLKKTQRPLHQSVGLENLRKRIRIMNDKYDFEGSPPHYGFTGRVKRKKRYTGRTTI
jgi:putative methionine-R-sulfoxide reductase with GAF domain